MNTPLLPLPSLPEPGWHDLWPLSGRPLESANGNGGIDHDRNQECIRNSSPGTRFCHSRTDVGPGTTHTPASAARRSVRKRWNRCLPELRTISAGIEAARYLELGPASSLAH